MDRCLNIRHGLWLPVAVLLCCLCGCGGGSTPEPGSAKPAVNYADAAIPAFDADSAYAFAAAQMAFGPRTPNSQAHKQCREYLHSTMRRWCDTVFLQNFSTTLWNGTQVSGTNIIASQNLQASSRIVLAAHWDSRLWADHDGDSSNHRKAVPGANDGASGCALLMEMARGMQLLPPGIGVDFIFFDMEDQGLPEWADVYEDNTWCLGSQYWARNKHVPVYSAIYGVLFDMVGTTQPRFTKEEASRHYAPGITAKLWKTAAALGYGSVFVDLNTPPILDDHVYVNQMAGIPMVDIVQNSVQENFFAHWHTTTDDMNHLDANTMKLVATVVMKTIYGDYPSRKQ